MLHCTFPRPVLLAAILTLLLGVYPAAADSSHVRIVRLSLLEGDVRFTRDAQGDPLSDQKAAWETAVLNLPIRQGYVLATGEGRAEVEFENGAMAFLGANTVIEFYDLSRDDSAVTSRLILRQGTASFYVHPAGADYFSVTGSDFTVEATSRAGFRLDSYDDGSTVNVFQGRVAVLHKEQTSRVDKGQSLSLHAGDSETVNMGRAGEADDFDHWVSGRIDSVSLATASAMQYTALPYYASGFADLYNYGAFSSCGGYGFGWRPFGAGFGWSPFTNGQWFLDPTFGWTWVSFQPWGWAPYHYGSWLFDASCGGWFYSAPVLYGYQGYPAGPGRPRPVVYHPPHPIYRGVTGVFVRQGGAIGIVPIHPLDKNGKTPLNLQHGVFSNVGKPDESAHVIAVEPGQKWQTLKSPPREIFSGSLAATVPPSRVSRTVLSSNGNSRAVTVGRDSSISSNAPATPPAARAQTLPPPRAIIAPPPASHTSAYSGSRGQPSHGGGGSNSSGGSSHPSGSASSPHSSSPSSSPSHSSGGSSGGHPH